MKNAEPHWSTWYDFRSLSSGTLVTRSEHYYQEHSIPRNKRGQLGILVRKEFYDENDHYEKGKGPGVVCYPVIHWEGEVMSSITHPSLAMPFRKKRRR